MTDAERSGRRRRCLKSLGVGIGAFLLLGVGTGLLPNPVSVRMVERTPADNAVLFATASFAAAFVSQRSLPDDPIGGRFAAGGSVGGFPAFGCPICIAVLLVLFSSSALLTYFDLLRAVLGPVSVPRFAGIRSDQRRGSTRC